MATAFGTATASASAAAAVNNAPKSSPCLPLGRRHFHHSHPKVSFRLTPKPKLRFCSKGLQSPGNRSAVARAQLNEVSVGGSPNATATSPAKSAEVKDVKSSNEAAPAPVASEESVSQFMSQVSDLVKLVDSRDIVELQLKQLDCELLIRKKEALPPPPSPAPVMIAPSHFAPPVAPAAAAPAHAPAAASAPAPAPKTAPPASPAVQSPKSSRPPLKCPMAGTFYRSPAPSEPPFVKIGDKVKKGQVLCIIEAMKLMNEIEVSNCFYFFRWAT